MSIDLSAIQERIKGLPSESSTIFLDGLRKLLDENREDIKALGPEALTALLTVHLAASVAIPDLSDDDPEPLHLLQAQLLAKHAAAMKQVAVLQKNQSERFIRLEDSVKGFALKIGPVVGALLVKAALG